MPISSARIAELAAAVRRGTSTKEEAVDRFVALVLSAHTEVPASGEAREYLTRLILDDDALWERFGRLFEHV